MALCRKCGGLGRVTCTNCGGRGRQGGVSCYHCGGTGRSLCYSCAGSGSVSGAESGNDVDEDSEDYGESGDLNEDD